MSRDIEFDETTSWYGLSASTADPGPMPEDEASEPEPTQIEDEKFETLDESLESFRLSRSNE